MTGFAKFLERRRRVTARDYDKATSERFRVVRFDGVTLGGSTSRFVAERLRNTLCQGQRADFAVVMVRGGES